MSVGDPCIHGVIGPCFTCGTAAPIYGAGAIPTAGTFTINPFDSLKATLERDALIARIAAAQERQADALETLVVLHAAAIKPDDMFPALQFDTVAAVDRILDRVKARLSNG